MSSRVSRKNVNRVVREQIAREKRRRRTIIISVSAVVALVVVGLVGWAIAASQTSSSYAVPKNVSSDGTGLLVANNDGKPNVELFADYLCPNCKNFEQEAGPTLAQYVQDKQISYVYHPIAILDYQSSTNYSTRAASAAACASDLGKFTEFSQALFGQQPPEGGAGLTDERIIQIGTSAGLADPAFAKCVNEGKYKGWVAHITEESARRGVTGTPTVMVNGKKVESTREAVAAAVNG